MTPGFPPHVLREYALIADGERGALIGPHGDLTFMCAPSWDSDPVFCDLIGGRGSYAVTPRDPRRVWGGYYEPGSLIWRSRWVTSNAVIECREALAYPGEPDRALILRQVRAIDGDAHLDIILDPHAGFGHDPLHDLRCLDGRWSGRTGALALRWFGAADAKVRDGHLHATLDLPAGGRHDLILEIADQPSTVEVDAGRLWSATEQHWRERLPTFPNTIAPRDAQHAFAILRGLTNHTGAMVAAATMALPERAEAGRDYDYRYAWIRDQCLAGNAAAAAGVPDLLHDAIGFVTGHLLIDGPRLRPAYTPSGETVPDERRLPLPGYPGGFDRMGNRVNQQFQLDIFGECLLLYAQAARHSGLARDERTAASLAIHAIQTRGGEPDAGIWELPERHWTHSRLMCIAGLRAYADTTTPAEAATCRYLADRLLASCTPYVHHTGRWQRAADDDRVDAALLLPGIRGAVPPDDPRTQATYRAVVAELSQDGYIYRYRPDERPLGQAEGAFLLCGFLAAMAAHQLGAPLAAVRWFERSRTACGPPGLLTEEFDVTQRQLRGNLPQAFVHAALLEAASRLASSQPRGPRPDSLRAAGLV